LRKDAAASHRARSNGHPGDMRAESGESPGATMPESTDQQAEIIRLQEEIKRLNGEIARQKKSQEILAAFFENTLFSVVILDKDFNFIRVNETYARACSREVADFPGHNHFDFFPSNAKDIFEDTVRTKKAYITYARAFSFPDHPEWGTTYWDWMLVPILDAAGEVELLILTLNDVTERVRSQAKLMETEDQYRVLFDNSLDGVLLMTPNGSILSANPAACRMLGRSEEEICAAGRDGIVDIDDPRVRSALHERPEQGSASGEMNFLYKDGAKIPVEVTTNIFQERNGRILTSMFFRDITQRKKSEESLIASRELFYKIFRLNPLAMAIQKLDSQEYVDVNENYVARYGYSREDLIGAKITDIGIQVDAAETEKFTQEIQQKGYASNYEVRYRKKTGEVLNVLLSGVVINYNGITCILRISSDITELRSYQQEIARLDRLNLIGEMAASIGHEIRNPMTTVRGFLQLLQERERDTQDREMMGIMIEELDRANLIISEYLSLAKNKIVELSRKNLNEEIKHLLPLMEADAVRQDKSIQTDLTEIPDIAMDKNEIYQLILNLVRNGLEAMAPGGLLTIRTFYEEEKVVLSFRDQGPGMPPEVLEKIGTPFFTTKESGTGLGLAVCYSIAYRHNAKIDIESGPDGTTIFVRFPALPPTS